MALTPPCYDRTNNIDCTQRTVGCRETCSKWKEYEAAYRERQAVRKKHIDKADVEYTYQKQSKDRIIRRRHK